MKVKINKNILTINHIKWIRKKMIIINFLGIIKFITKKHFKHKIKKWIIPILEEGLQAKV